MFVTLEGLILHVRDKLKAMFTLNNLMTLHDKVDEMAVNCDIYGSIEEMMLSNEPMMRLNCRDPRERNSFVSKELFISESVPAGQGVQGFSPVPSPANPGLQNRTPSRNPVLHLQSSSVVEPGFEMESRGHSTSSPSPGQ
eukprot:765857-Hanusia_phi.AAC.3